MPCVEPPKHGIHPINGWLIVATPTLRGKEIIRPGILGYTKFNGIGSFPLRQVGACNASYD